MARAEGSLIKDMKRGLANVSHKKIARAIC